MFCIREEQEKDYPAVYQLNLQAFNNGPEAVLVDKLRNECDHYLSFVAEDDGSIVGHIFYSPVTIEGSQITGLGLAPMAVLPSYQRKGVGSRLINHSLNCIKGTGCPFVIVLGHPEYYPRFNFEPASKYKLICQWQGVPDEAFMALVLDKGALPDQGGTANYHRLFEQAM